MRCYTHGARVGSAILPQAGRQGHQAIRTGSLLCAGDMATSSTRICITANTKCRTARSVTMPPFHYRAFLRGCLLGTSILLGVWLLGAVAVWLVWRFMFSAWW